MYRQICMQMYLLIYPWICVQTYPFMRNEVSAEDESIEFEDELIERPEIHIEGASILNGNTSRRDQPSMIPLRY